MYKFNNYNKSIICIEIESFVPEKFINLLWKNNISVKNIQKKNITTMIMEVKLNDYEQIEGLAKKSKTKVRIIGRYGFSLFLISMKKRIALFCGIFLFIGILYYLSTFIWGIDIETEKIVPPYEIRNELAMMGIRPGINKKYLNVNDIEERMVKNNENITWARVRIEGSRLKIRVVERVSPPGIIKDETPCNLVSKQDGIISRVYTSSGTAIVKTGDIVKKGQLLVKGEQGNEGNVYPVHAKGEVIAKTFYENSKTVNISGTKKVRTGESFTNYYIDINKRKIYLKNTANKYENYDKIVVDNGFIKKEIYYKIKDVNYTLDANKVIQTSSDELYNSIVLNLDKNIKIVDRKTETTDNGDTWTIRVWITAEEDVALPEKIQ